MFLSSHHQNEVQKWIKKNNINRNQQRRPLMTVNIVQFETNSDKNENIEHNLSKNGQWKF